jgi:diguanylate cyclase (GGDEF)-like protein/PAS domain S-box-containing protein
VHNHPERQDDGSLNFASSTDIRTDEFRPFYEFSTQLLCILAADTKFHRTNPAFEDAMGLPEHDLRSRSFVDFIHSEDVGIALDEFKRLGSGVTRLAFEVRFRCRGGVYRLLRWDLYPDAGRHQLYALATDVTEQRLLRRRVEELETVDPLTGARTREGFEQAMRMEWRRLRRISRPLSVALVEFDDVERYIERVGRMGFEECLKRLGAILPNHARRAGDVVARYQEAVFAVIWYDADLDSAREMAEAIRSEVERMRVGHHGEHADGRVTVSVGLCSVTPTGGRDPFAVVKAASAALEAAEREGRNRVVTSVLRTPPEWEDIAGEVQAPELDAE